nr:hypothetical protein [Candidatus Gracilibacteria bacterium]
MKKLSLLLATLLIASVSFAYADDNNTGSTDDNDTETSTGMEDSTTTTESGSATPTQYKNREMMEQRNQEMEALKEQKKNEIEANKEQMQANKEAYKEARGTGSLVLTDEQKVQLKAIMDSHKAQADEIRNMISSGSLTQEEGQDKLEALRETTYESLKALLGDEETAQRLLGMKKDMLDKNQELRQDNMQIRQDYNNARQTLRVKYKTQFMSALGTRLDAFDTAKLQLVLTRIDAAIANTEANTNLSQTNKDKLLAQLDALKEIINEKLGNLDPNSNIDINSLLQ